MTHDEVVADIRRYGFNTIRWGKPPFDRKMVQELIAGQRRPNFTPEYFLVGVSAVSEVRNYVDEFCTVQFMSGGPSNEFCRIAGIPLYINADMPADMIALVSPDYKLFPGEKWEMVAHTASYVKITG